MSTKTISLKEDAYSRLKSLKEKEESFSDVVNRIVSESKLSDGFGILDEETADDLEEAIRKSRKENLKNTEKRSERIEDALE